MNLRSYQDFLAKLYTDPQLRTAFFSSPESVGAQAGLNKEQIAELSGELYEELDYFSKTLISKRFQEVAKLLPLTRTHAGDDFEPLFREFAGNFVPATVKKHLEDAVAFLDFLAKREIAASVRGAVRFERTKLRFLSSNKRFAVCRIGAEIRESLSVARSSGVSAKLRKPRFGLWFRHGRWIKHLLI